jgi:hypothetical protein
MVNTVYSLVPEGRQFASYRFMEVLCLGSIPILYTHKSELYWPWPRTIQESEWLNCVHVFRHAYLVTALAYRNRFGDGDDAREREKACERLRANVCLKNSRVKMTIVELASIEDKRRDAMADHADAAQKGILPHFPE